MYRNGRPFNPQFEPGEALYRMFRPEAVEADRLLAAFIPFDAAMSVNRSKYSEPGDILSVLRLKYAHWGVVRFRVSDVPTRMESEAGVLFEWFVEHAPEEDNYAHSEVRTFRNRIHSKTSTHPRSSRSVSARYSAIVR